MKNPRWHWLWHIWGKWADDGITKGGWPVQRRVCSVCGRSQSRID